MKHTMIENRLNVLLAERRWKVTDLAEKCSVSYKTLLKLSNGETKRIDFETLDQLCAAMDCEIGDILRHVRGDVATAA